MLFFFSLVVQFSLSACASLTLSLRGLIVCCCCSCVLRIPPFNANRTHNNNNNHMLHVCMLHYHIIHLSLLLSLSTSHIHRKHTLPVSAVHHFENVLNALATFLSMLRCNTHLQRPSKVFAHSRRLSWSCCSNCKGTSQAHQRNNALPPLNNTKRERE